MSPRPAPDAAPRRRSTLWFTAVVIELVLLVLVAAAPSSAASAVTVERQEVRAGYGVYRQAMKDFLEGEYCADAARRPWNFWRRLGCDDLWLSARRGIERVLADYPDSLEHGEEINVNGRRIEYYRPHYYLAICLCELGERESADESFQAVMNWYKNYRALQWYVDRCVLPTCAEEPKNLPKGCSRPRTSVASTPRASQKSAGSSASGASGMPLCSPTSPGAAPW